MKFETISNDNYKVYINNLYESNLNIENKEEVGKFIKDIILKIRKIYNVLLEGLYEVDVYVIKYLGIVLEIKNIDRYISKTVDLKIIIRNEEEIYLKIPRFELLDEYHDLKYLNNNFYLNINSLLEKDIYKLLESFEIVYGSELEEIKTNWCSLTT